MFMTDYYLQLLLVQYGNPYVYLWNEGLLALIMPLLAGIVFSKLIDLVSLSDNITFACSSRFFSLICVLKI
jgi:hypothetical protein